MTTIAFDGQTLAADRAAWSGSVKFTVRKVHRIVAPNGKVFLVAMCGDGPYAEQVLRWMKGGKHPGSYPNDENTTIGLVIDDKRRIWRLNAIKLTYSRVLDKIHATGAGQEFAIGALEAGATAKQAVQIAMKRSDYAGLGVDTVTF